MPLHLSTNSWLILCVAGITIGLAKSGLSGLGIVAVLLFAEVFPARESTGMLLLSLVVGDCCSVIQFHRLADWKQLRRVILPAILGVLVGWWSLDHVTDAHLRPIMGYIILILVALQLLRKQLGVLIETSYHGHWFAWAMGGLGGWTTMMANAAGPVMSLFFLAMKLPKFVFVGTSAWFFLGINLFKVPFSINLGLIHWDTLELALCLSPLIFLSVHFGRWLLNHISQNLFEIMILLFAFIGTIRLIWF